MLKLNIGVYIFEKGAKMLGNAVNDIIAGSYDLTFS